MSADQAKFEEINAYFKERMAESKKIWSTRGKEARIATVAKRPADSWRKQAICLGLCVSYHHVFVKAALDRDPGPAMPPWLDDSWSHGWTSFLYALTRRFCTGIVALIFIGWQIQIESTIAVGAVYMQLKFTGAFDS
eukprot:scaffold24903_cov49-Attheya_sp.AAC.3